MTSVWPTSSNAPDPAFSALACSWMPDPSEKLLGFIWEAYDDMASNRPVIETKDLERSITQLLEQRVDDAMSGDEPFYVQHGSFEHETMAAPLRSRRHMTLLLFYVLMSALCGRLRQRCLRHLVDWPIMLKM